MILMVLPCYWHLQAQPSEQIHINDDIQLLHLSDSVFVHVSWENSTTYGRFPSNGMIIIRKGEAVMIDTPMDNAHTSQLVSFLEDSMHVTLKKLIVGHYHDDCLGGLKFIQNRGIPSIANWMTIEKCKELELPVPTISFRDSLIFDFNGETIECRFFGGGHTFDNITVCLPEVNILFGGCLIRSINAQSLGNIADAEVEHWAATVTCLSKKYPDLKFVVPGHGHYGNSELLKHTIQLVNSYQNRNK